LHPDLALTGLQVVPLVVVVWALINLWLDWWDRDDQ